MSEFSMKSNFCEASLLETAYSECVLDEQVDFVEEDRQTCEFLMQENLYMDSSNTCLDPSDESSQSFYLDQCESDRALIREVTKTHESMGRQWSVDGLSAAIDYFRENNVPIHVAAIPDGVKNLNIVSASTNVLGAKIKYWAITNWSGDPSTDSNKGTQTAAHETIHYKDLEWMKTNHPKAYTAHYQNTVNHFLSPQGLIDQTDFVLGVLLPENASEAEKVKLRRLVQQTFGFGVLEVTDRKFRSNTEFLYELLAVGGDLYTGNVMRLQSFESPGINRLSDPKNAQDIYQILVMAQLQEAGLWDEFKLTSIYNSEFENSVDPDQLEIIKVMLRQSKKFHSQIL